MVKWVMDNEGEGAFESSFFKGEDGNELSVYANPECPDYRECAEKCVTAFNSLPDTMLDEICEGIIGSAEEVAEDFEMKLESPRDVLNYCWFTALYADMSDKSDEISFVVEGEGDWGEVVGFYIKNNKVVYVGTDYMDYMET